MAPLGASSIGASVSRSGLGVRVRPREVLRLAAGEDIAIALYVMSCVIVALVSANVDGMVLVCGWLCPGLDCT